jgi:hypothetical protein
VRVQARRHRLNYAAKEAATSRHRIRARPSVQDRADEPVFSMRLPGTTAPHHLSVQWDQLVVPEDGGEPVRAQSRSLWMDSLTTLPSGNGLALSDLVPVKPGTYDPGTSLRTADGWSAEPYPFREIEPGSRLGLYVEAYRLARRDDGSTRYTVEYAVTQTDVPQSRLAEIFRDPASETTTTTATTVTGRTSTAREYVEIDLTDVHGADTVTIVLRVTDTVSGHTAQRTLQFEVEK